MVSIGQYDLGVHVQQIVAGHGLDRCRGRNRHKERRLDHPMRGRDPPPTGISILVFFKVLKKWYCHKISIASP